LLIAALTAKCGSGHLAHLLSCFSSLGAGGPLFVLLTCGVCSYCFMTL